MKIICPKCGDEIVKRQNYHVCLGCKDYFTDNYVDGLKKTQNTIEKGGKNKMGQRTFPVKEFVKLEDGSHSGKIVRVEYRDTPYSYVDIVIEVDDTTGFELRYGCPANISEATKLGKLLQTFGMNLVVGTNVTEEQIAEVLVGKAVNFVTVTDVVKKDGQTKEYANISDGSVKPKTEVPVPTQ